MADNKISRESFETLKKFVKETKKELCNSILKVSTEPTKYDAFLKDEKNRKAVDMFVEQLKNKVKEAYGSNETIFNIAAKLIDQVIAKGRYNPNTNDFKHSVEDEEDFSGYEEYIIQDEDPWFTRQKEKLNDWL